MGDDEPERGASGAVAGEVDALGRGGVARGEPWLVGVELGRGGVGARRIERAALRSVVRAVPSA